MARKSLILFAPVILISHLTARGHALVVTHTIMDVDLQSHCAVNLGGMSYNLCPLMGLRRIVDVTGISMSEDNNRGEGPSSGRRLYKVDFGERAFTKSPFNPDSTTSRCDWRTWVCMSDVFVDEGGDTLNAAGEIMRSKLSRINTRSIFKKERGSSVEISLDIDEDNFESQTSPLKLILYSGGKGKKTLSVEMSISCSSVDDLRFVGENDSVHSFVWATRHGCPTKSRRDSVVSISQDPGSEDEEPPPENEKADGDLLPGNRHKTRQWIAIIMALLVTTIIGGSILFSSARARHFTKGHLHSVAHTFVPILFIAAIKLQPIGNSISYITSKTIERVGSRFRQGDSRLVRWAQEDMALDSDDVMVNGAGAYGQSHLDGDGWDEDGLDEYIPLTISPKYGKGRRIRSYGATPDVETFEERGLMSGIGKYFKK